ncbi:BtrH N-terminal domain-containing protein [Paenibacillus polysaccharolyticus]|uniref:BtrH N-terminal domain-containing protein n=1 Tax=Paenibacillus polysaccharolyticus TaxID=582692 RepID=UPI0020422CA5|nr:BtrH N-terminal domain-containing protein [Paenibacillus polysaccharolyticus]MCM3133072.1 BtrH N-terminal domain-containing protein [Paenibacillus polysaccharolyticus]
MDNVVSLPDFEYFKGMKKMFPQSDYPFLNCSYNSLLTIADYYHKDTFSIINNFVTIYRFDKNKIKDRGFFKLEVVNFKILDEVLAEIGITVNPMLPDTENLQSQIRTSLAKGNPVAIYIDLYYQRGRELYYFKQHGPHPVLVYGFNSSTNEVYIIDDITEYKKYTVPFEEIRQACMSEYIEGNQPRFLEFTLNSTYTDAGNIEEIYKESFNKYKHVMLNYKSEIMEGLQSIESLAEHYEDIIKNEDIIETLSSTIYRKCSEKYRLAVLFLHNPEIAEKADEVINTLLDGIIDDWTNLRAISTKAVYSQRFNHESVLKCVRILHAIHQKEMLFTERLFQLIEETK